MKTVLITGGCGFIGSHLSLLLKKKKFKVIVIDNLKIGKEKLFKGNKFHRIDLVDKKKLDTVFKKYNFIAVFHLAGLSKVTESTKKKNLYKTNNIHGTINILKAIKKYNVKYLVFSSSASVYGKQNKFPITEKAKLKPISYYGKTKLICENLIKKESINSNFKSICLRYFNVIGSDFKNKLGEIHNPPIHLIPISVQNILNNKIVKLRSGFLTKDGTGIRDYIDVNDVANAHFKSLIKLIKTNKDYFAINLGSKKSISAKEVLNKLKNYFKNKRIKISYSKKIKGEPDKLLASKAFAGKTLKWSPKVKFDRSLKNMIAWEKYKLKNRKYFIN